MNPTRKKILIADSSKEFLMLIKKHSQAKNFNLETTTDGMNCLKKIKEFEPDLVITEFMLPGAHGIEILNTVKNSSLIAKTGVILTCYHTMYQNYHSAVRLGASYIAEKPITAKALFTLIKLFFAGTLRPEPFSRKTQKTLKNPIIPAPKQHTSYLKFWGTRGSNPVAGADYVRFGGNTPCLEIRNDKDLVIIDSGSGIRDLGETLGNHPHQTFNILLSHTHWDHLLGFPFFPAIHKSNKQIKIFAPIGFEKTTKQLFEDMLAYAYFPVSFNDVESKLFFKDLRDNESLSFGKIKVFTHYAFHPGPTLCFKIQIGKKTIGYVTDNEFLLGCNLPLEEIEKNESLFRPYESLIAFLTGCDILIHEAQYFPEEYASKVGWGHSSIFNASFLIKKAKITHWIITHHDPRHTDSILLEKSQLHIQILEKIKHKCLIQLAYDGMTIPIE